VLHCFCSVARGRTCRSDLLDLRGNGGGYLEQAVAVANLFVERGRLLVYTQGRRRSTRENHYAKRDTLFPPDQPLIILVAITMAIGRIVMINTNKCGNMYSNEV